MSAMKPDHHHPHPSRRSFLGQALAAPLSAALLDQAFIRAAKARAATQVASQPTLFTLTKVAPGAYSAIAKPKTIINCNAVIFENAKYLLIVDAHSKPSAAAALVAQVRREITPKPIRYIVNTHFHWDHSEGDPAYRRLAPGAEIITSDTTRELLSQFGAARARIEVEGAEASIPDLLHRLESAKTPEEKQRIRRSIAEIHAFAAEMHNYQPELPDLTFDSSLTLHDKEHELQLTFRGRGHTGGDVVVFCPQNKILATGDLLHGWFPFIGDGYPRDWPKTLATLKELPFATIVGGHGQAQQGDKRLTNFSNYIAELTEAVASQKSVGRSVTEIQSAVTAPSLHSLDDEYQSFLVSQLSDGQQTPAELIASNVKSNIADIFRRLDQS
jgi:glyoxylase-like metal-dependent hydrolase (beta-lactamase superfamily II)